MPLNRRLLVFTCLLLSAGATAHSQPPGTVFLEELTWTELRDLVKSGKTTIIVPIGGTEQNGPHMALGKHNRRVQVLSEKIARVLGNALVAPVIAYVPEGGINPPTEHMRFPGTITVPEEAFEKILEFTARSFKHRRLPRYRIFGRSRRVSASREGCRRAARSGVVGNRGSCPRHRGVLSGE